MSAAEWKLEREIWAVGDSGFKFLSRDGKTNSASWSSDRIGALLGFKPRSSSCSSAAGCSQYYPNAFKYCPSCGSKLESPALRNLQTWLPPYGNLSSKTSVPSGLRLTETPLTVDPENARSRPDVELELPRGTSFRFVVGSLGDKASGLLAIDVTSGSLYALTTQRTWSPLEPSGSVTLAECSLPEGGWQMACEDLNLTNHLLLPTDHGLCIVEVDLPSLTYRAEYVNSEACIGAPVSCAGNLIVPCRSSKSSISLYFKPLASRGATWQSTSVELDGAPTDGFASATSTGRRSIWEASVGQLVVSISPAGKLMAEFVQWPDGFAPWFDLGSPYRDKQDQFWRQCKGAKGGTHYVKLGGSPEIWGTDGPRFGSGGLSFRQGVVILERDKPWDEVHAEGEAATKVVIPLVEHDSEDIALCAEVDWTLGVGRLLATQEKVKGRFALRGRLNREILNFDVKRPWYAAGFVWDGYLFLYHPDLDSIPGWRLV